MELLFTFNGIRLNEGEMPRALVRAQFAIAELPDHLPTLKIDMSFPINDAAQPLEVTAQRALELARSLLNESVAVQWMTGLPQAPLEPLCFPADAAERIQAMPEVKT